MGKLFTLLDANAKAPGYVPSNTVEIIDADEVAELKAKNPKRPAFVADVPSTFNGKTTIKRRLIMGGREVLVDRATNLALLGAVGNELHKVAIDLNTITITVWEPTKELLAKSPDFKPSYQASFDFDIKA